MNQEKSSSAKASEGQAKFCGRKELLTIILDEIG
jgi:hypothetical protein